ncbi:MAG TPA: hypothetical protein VMK30_02250 [Pleomorphomonadaceae bacterium]|nr:hypothetical protein [Pleomorphomonadaceae bacterium]
MAERPIFEPTGSLGGTTQAVAFDGTLVYTHIGKRIVVVDPSDPAAPRVVGQTEPLFAEPVSLAVDGSRLYVAMGEGGFEVVWVGDPANPQPVGIAQWYDHAAAVAVSPQAALFAGHMAGGEETVWLFSHDGTFPGDRLPGQSHSRQVRGGGGDMHDPSQP